MLIPRHVCSYEKDDIETVQDFYGVGISQTEKNLVDLSYEYNKYKGIFDIPQKLKGITTNIFGSHGLESKLGCL